MVVLEKLLVKTPGEQSSLSVTHAFVAAGEHDHEGLVVTWGLWQSAWALKDCETETLGTGLVEDTTILFPWRMEEDGTLGTQESNSFDSTSQINYATSPQSPVDT